MFCNNCGAELKDNAQFCPKCGEKTNQTDATEAVKEDIKTEKTEKSNPVTKKKKRGVIWGVIIVVLLLVAAVVIFLVLNGFDSGSDEKAKNVESGNNSSESELREDTKETSDEAETEVTDTSKEEQETTEEQQKPGETKEPEEAQKPQETQEPEETKEPEEVVEPEQSEWKGLIDGQNLLAEEDKNAVVNEISLLKDMYGYDIFVVVDSLTEIADKEEYIADIYRQNGISQPQNNQAICLFVDAETARNEIMTFGTDISGFDNYVVNSISLSISAVQDESDGVYRAKINKFLSLCKEQLSVNGKSVDEWGITTAGTVDLMNCATVALLMVDASEEGKMFKGSRATGALIMAMPYNGAGENKAVFIDGNIYLNIGDNYGKYSSTYAKNGAEAAIKALNSNFDMAITDFVALGKYGLDDIIDYFGGMDAVVDVLDRTMMYGYGEEAEQHAVGLQHLNGEQVVNYCFGTYSAGIQRRKQNQAEVLNYISQKLQEMSDSEYNAAMEFISSRIYTNLEIEDVLYVLRQYAGTEMAMFPYSDMSVTGTMGSAGSVICSDDLVAGVKRMHYELYGDKDYIPSGAIEEISAYIDTKIEEYSLNK